MQATATKTQQEVFTSADAPTYTVTIVAEGHEFEVDRFLKYCMEFPGKDKGSKV